MPHAASGGASFPLVGIGASAGGLDAFKQLLRAVPQHTGMAFVFIQHLHPTHQSILADVLRRETPLPVHEVTGNIRFEPDNVYVIAPATTLEVADCWLRTSPRRDAQGPHRPIDILFHSLAANATHKPIGVVLSGDATDGTLGLGEIKAAGGITFAQDSTAQHESMPRSAVAAGCVDFIMSPADIAREIARIARDPYVQRPEQRGQQSRVDLTGILNLLHMEKGVDFTQYMPNTIQRRVRRRMALQHVTDVKSYARLLKKNPAELDALYHDMLINVTSFFRDPEAFDVLKSNVFPALLKDRSSRDTLRVWVLGCATGEEAYSIAIALTEYMEASGKQVPIQLFATDLDTAYVHKARAGFYPLNIVKDVSPERLRRHFIETDGSYQVKESIRDMCVFAAHNVLTDPPFARIDLVTCRNLLIYLGADIQQRVVPILHYSLRSGGYLWLGSSETITSYRHLFEFEDSKHKIYRKKLYDGGVALAAFGTLRHPSPVHPGEPGSVIPGVRESLVLGVDPYKEADHVLLAKYAPASVLVNTDFDILQFRGDTGRYLMPAAGKASLNLLKMLREGLLVAVRGALVKARKEDVAVRRDGLRVNTNDGYRNLSIQVLPLRAGNATARCFVVVFEEPRLVQSQPGQKSAVSAASETERGNRDAEIARLKQELAATREYLQSMIEQQEAANEELMSANEEVQSSNEELQTINEELEISKEEVQSTNEELATINEELHNRNAELSQSNNDLVNLLSSAQMAIIILGPDLHIRRFTPAAERLFNLIPVDIGRPIGDLNLNISVPDLESQLEAVLDTMSVKEFDVRDQSGRWYFLRLRPYRTMENKIDGVVLTLIDVDTLQRTQQILRRQTELLEQAHEPIIMWELDGGIVYWNKASEDTYGYTRKEATGRRSHQLLESSPPFSVFRQALLHDGHWTGDLVQTRRDGQKIIVESRMALVREAGDRNVVVEANRPITERKEMERILRRRADDLVEADRNKDEFLAMLAHELRNPLAPLRNIVQVLRAADPDASMRERGLQMMERQIQNMSRLLDDLLDVSRVTLSTMELRKERVDVGALAARVADLSRAYTDARDQTLEVTSSEKPLYVFGDPVRMEQIVGNLLNNASKYTPRGGHVRVETCRTSNDDGDIIEIRVSDDGIDISADMLPRVFDLFMHAGRSVDAAHGGLGIGLTLVRRLVELHGGTITATSAGAGKGSEFIVHLPPCAEEEDLPARETPSASAAGPGTCARRRILVVDDNTDAADSQGMILAANGHEVEVAYDSASAIEAAKRFHPEVVMLDIELPDTDGYCLARELRSQPSLEKVKLVAISGYGHEEARQRAREAGFDHYLTKPADPAVLEQLLDWS